MKLITNRAVIIVRPKAPYIDWVRSADDESKPITAEEIAAEPNVYLVGDYETDGEKDDLIAKNYKEIFEAELNGWLIDKSTWPKKRDLKTFREWFHVNFHSIVFDLRDEDYMIEER
jgi:hypothetical protein